jgi:hypothetical protein
MKLVAALLLGYLALTADTDRLPLSDEEKGPVETLTDLAQLAKGRILVCFIKEGMTIRQVSWILGCPNLMVGNFGTLDEYWDDYGIWVYYATRPPSGVPLEKYESKVTKVRWQFPPDFRWNRLWSFGSASHKEIQKPDGPTSFPDPDQVIHELINDSEDLQEDLDYASEDEIEAKFDEESKADPRLETLLQQWKKADQEIREFHCIFQLTTEDRILKDKETTHGEVFFKKPDLVRVDSKDKNGKLSQIWVFQGKTIRFYYSRNQTEGVIDEEIIGRDNKMDWLIKWLAPWFESVRCLFTALPFDETEKRFDFHLNKEDKD